jgi:hypothetical protein
MLRFAVSLVVISGFACGTVNAQQPAEQAKPMSIKEVRAKIHERFVAADSNHDRKLTRDEAQAGMPKVYENFDKIDVRHRGYVTERQIGAYWSAVTKAQAQKADPIWN